MFFSVNNLFTSLNDIPNVELNFNKLLYINRKSNNECRYTDTPSIVNLTKVKILFLFELLKF